MSKRFTGDEVREWIVVNLKRRLELRLLTRKDVARRTEYHPQILKRVFSNNWQGCYTTQKLQRAVDLLVSLCNALDMTPAELFSRPDDMSLLHEDGRKTRWETTRRKKQIKLTQEQQERQALLESMGLDVD